ncbi:unnamed protein product [Arctia plantaginis]|uniref:Uncharacterized protein n=1 Tax=Arctia plantaginis TaxID=874455 RepID=A0A8S1AC01_ARCPL|nr:unnamed protein product [Arctia plantaginis]
MKPVHGDTVSNDSSSSAWCSYSNQSGLSFRRLSPLQGARTDRILQEKYIPLKENNLLEKLVKTRVLYEELRHQILSSSLSTSSKGNLISATQPLVVDYPIGIVKREISHRKMQDSKSDMKIKQNCYVDHWNYNFECSTELSPRDCSGRNNHRIADSFLKYLPFTSDVKEHAEYSSNRELEKSKSFKNNILAKRTYSSKILKQNENLSVLGLCQTIKSKENSSLVLQGQNSTHLAKTISMLLATCKRSARLVSIDSMPKVDSGLLINETNCKTLANSKLLSSMPVEVKKTSANKNKKMYKNINMLPSDCCTDFEMKVMASNCTVHKKRSLDHSKHSNSCQETNRKSSNIRFNFSKNLIKSPCFSENETKNITKNQHTKLDHVRQEIQNHSSLRDKARVDPSTFVQHHKDKRNLDRKLQEHRQKRISKSIKIGSHALKRCFCTLKLKTMHINNERHKIPYINECIPSKTFIHIKKRLPCELFLCASGEHVSTKCNSWKIQYNTSSKLTSKSLTALEQYRTITNLLQVKTSRNESCKIATNYKNILENSWPVKNKKSETGCSLDKTKCKFKKPCSHKYLCPLNQSGIKSGNIIPKTTKLSKSTIVSLGHIVPKRVSKESELVLDAVPSLTKRKPFYRTPTFEQRIFNNPITGVVIINDAESTITPSVKRRKTKSGTSRSQPVYKLLEINKVQSNANTYNYSLLSKNNEVHRNHHSESQKFIGNDRKELLKGICMSNHNIIHENPEYFNKKHTNILKSNWKGSPLSKKYKLVKIQNETYLMITSSSKHIFSTLLKSNCMINDNATRKYKHIIRNVGNRNKYCKESNTEKGNTTELLRKPRYIQVHANEPQKSKMNKRVEKGRYRKNEIATQVPQNNYESHICESKGLYKNVQFDEKYKAKWGNVKNYKKVSKDKFNSVQNPQKQQCFLRKSSSIISISSTFAIKSQTLQSNFQSKFKIFHLKSSDENETFQINSSLLSNPRKRNVMTQFSGRSLDIKPSVSSDAILYSSEIVQPLNPHLTGISSLLRRCFCTMNLHVGDGGESSKFQYKLKPYECAPYDCVPYECDPYECEKKITKRLTRKVSSTQTDRILKSSSNETSKNKKHQLVSMSEPKKSKSHRKVICDCRSNYSPKVKSYEKKPYSKTSYKVMKKERIRSDRTYRHIGHKTQSSIRKVRNKSSSIGPMLKRCLCTVKLLKNEEKNKTSDVSSVSTSTQSTNKGRNVRLNKNIGNDKHPESKTNRRKNTRDPALNVSSSIQSYQTKRKRKYIGSKSAYEKPVKSKEQRERKILSTPSARHAVRVGSNFSFSLEFYKDKTERKPSNEVYEQENRKYIGLSPNRSFRNLITQKDKSLTNTGSQASPIRQEQPAITGSFLKRCFCIKKKRSPKTASKHTTTGKEGIIDCQCKRSLSKIECECEKFINKKQSMDKASGTDKHRGFVLKKCDCIKLINKGQSIDKPSWADKHPRLLVSKECECKQVIDKKHHRSIGSETEKQVTKFKSSSTTSSKTSKARILHSSQYRQLKPNLLPETVRNEEIGGSSQRQAVRIGSNFSFEIEFHKDVQFPSDEKVQAAAEAIKETRDKMKDIRQMAAVRNKSRIGNSLYSITSEINTSNKASKAVGPLLRKCICKCSHQNNESLQNYNNKSKHSVHRGTATPVSRPIPNFHNRGVMTVYKLKTYPYKLAPYECEPGVCIPGECDPYECLKRMNRRHRGSSTDGYSTKSALSMTRPARRYRDNTVQFSPRDKRPHIREVNTRPREGIEVRQKPRQNKTRQAVRIGSNFSFNVEFYKDKSQGGIGGIGGTGGIDGVGGTGGIGRTGGIGPKPCPKPCPEPCPELCPKTCPKRFMSSGTDAANVNYRNKKAQRKRGQLHNRESQVWSRKMRSTMTGVGPFLKRCFCTLQLQRRHEKVLPRREERRDSDSSSVGTETARFRPEPRYKEQGTRPRRSHRYHGRKLDPNECEPGVCIPGQCDPYVCLERIKRRGVHTRHAGTGGRYRMHSVSSSMTEPGHRRHRNRSVSSSMIDHSRPRPRGQITHNQHRHRRNDRASLVKERTAYSPAPTSHRQAVRIGSSFSFNIEFYKDRNEQAPHVSAPVGNRRVHGRPSGAPVGYIKRPVPGRRLRTDSTGSGPMSTRTRSMSSSYKNNLRNRGMQAHSRTLLKRCFCTLKLQKIGTRQRQTQESTASIGTYYKAAGAQIRQKQEIVPQYRDFGTRTKRRRLEPYECEPGVCIPGQCDPYECLERIKRRHLRHSGTGMAYPHTRSMSNLTPYNFRTTSMNTAMGVYRTPGEKYHRRYTESPRRIKQPPPRPSRALENIHNRQAVRLGSSFSFNVEFYKDRSESEQQANLMSKCCTPNICVSECDPDNSVEPIKKRGLRRISRTTGNHMVRSRNSSSWYRRHPSEKVETIVEEPRFKIFNKPNTKQTVRISSNFNFNIEFFKDILFPEPCEVEEEFDEMSAVTEAINPQLKRKKNREDHYKPSYGGNKQFYAENYHPKYKHKNIRESIYEGDKLFSIEHYRPKIRSHKSLTGKEQDEHRKKIKPGKELGEHSKKLKPEVNKLSKKTGGPINKMFKCLCSPNEGKKYKCQCPSTELKGKKISNLGNKSKVAENIFANKTTTIARVEMGFYKQRLNRMPPTLNSPKFDLTKQPQHAKVTLGQINENSKALTVCQVPEKSSISKILYLYSPKLFWTAENSRSRPCTFSSNVQSITSLQVTEEKPSLKLLPTKFKVFSKAHALPIRNILVFVSSEKSKAKVAVSQKHFSLPNNPCSAMWPKTKSFHNRPFKADMRSRIETKFVTQRYPKFRNKIKSKNAIDFTIECSMSSNPVKDIQNDRFEDIVIESLDLRDSETCVAKVNKETTDTEDIESKKRDEEEISECLKALKQDDFEKTKQIVRNYNYHLFMTKMLICMTKMGLTNPKNAVGTDYGSAFNPKRAYRHFKCILLNIKAGLKCASGDHTDTASLKQKRSNFAKTIKNCLSKPTSKCLQSFKHIRKLHKRMLPKFLRGRKNTVDLGFNALDIACPQIKPQFSIYYMMPHFYPHFLTLRIVEVIVDLSQSFS